MPKLDPVPCDGRLPTGDKLRRIVRNLLNSGSDQVIALTDVHTGSSAFRDAADAKRKMQRWVGEEPRFHPHAALHEFEAWLIPYWSQIQRIAGSRHPRPAGRPESIDHQNPPSRLLSEVFRAGSNGRRYVKTRDAVRILREQDLAIAVEACPELKELVNTILGLSGAQAL